VTQEAAAYGITEEAYPDDYDAYVKSLQEYVLQNLVLNEIANQEAAKLGFAVTDEEVQAEVDTYVASYAGDQAAFEADLKAGGLTLDTFKKNLKEGLLRDKVRQEVIKDITSVPDEDVAAYYEANKSSYYVEPSRQLRHILIKPEAADEAASITDADWAAALATASEVRAKLVASGDWTALAAEYSDDFATKDKGGDLGTVTEGQKVKEFEDAAFALELDDISQPVKTVYGYELIQATGITVGGEQTLDKVRDQIVAQLLAKAQDEAWNKWLAERLAEAAVIYRDDLRPETTTTTESPTTTVLDATTTT
jgi:foldase protein PrsA